jgi:hypothetical protein
MSKPHDPDQLSKSNDSDRGAVASVWPYPRAPHVRDRRRLKLREGWTRDRVWAGADNEGTLRFTIWSNPDMNSRIAFVFGFGFTAYHADGSETDHATRLEAHDALVESGSPSPFEVVVGPAVKS